MITSLQFLYTVYFVSIFVHVVSLILALGFVIPLQVREARVKNGLLGLRRLMLISGLIMVVVNVASIATLTLRFFVADGEILRYTIVSLVFIHALGFLGFSIVKLIMYRQQYSIQQKQFHEKVARLERASQKRKKGV